MRGRCAGFVLLGLFGAARGAPPAEPPAAEPERFTLRPVTSVYEHLEDGRFGPIQGLYFEPRHGELWIADPAGDRIGIFDGEGLPLATLRLGKPLASPRRLVVTPDDEILLLDRDRSRIARLDWRGRYLGPLELPGLPEAASIAALAVDDEGALYVAEDESDELFVYTRERKLRLRFGGTGDEPGRFRSIQAIAVDRGRIAVIDAVATPVQLFDRHGALVLAFGAHAIGAENFSLPSDVAFAADGTIWVTDALRQEIKQFDAKGRFLARFGGYGGGRGQVSSPRALAFDASGRLWVAESGNGRAQLFERMALPPEPERRRPARRSWKTRARDGG